MTSGGTPAALVIGGTGRIGRAVAALLAARGWDVAVHCHAALTEARALAAACGGRSFAVTADLREEGAVRVVVHRVCDHFGRLDALVLCGRRRVLTPLEETTAGDLRTHFDVNVTGAFVAAQEAAATMAHQERGGTIVFVVDRDAEPAASGDVPHLTSRAALAGLAGGLAAEFAARHPVVRVARVAAGEPAATADAIVAELSRVTPAGGA